MAPNSPAPQGRPWKGVIFHCCGVYGRVYQNLKTGKWIGNCPKCLRSQAVKLKFKS